MAAWGLSTAAVPGRHATTSTADARPYLELRGVSCTSAGACTAVGSYATALNFLGTAPTERKTLAISWNGSGWEQQASPNPTGYRLPWLNAISCSAAGACTAVGAAQLSVSSAETVTLGEGWNGTSWSLHSTPNPPLPPNPVNRASLEGVSCPSSTFCMAVGIDANTDKGFLQSWDGSAWRLLSGQLEARPQGIACPTATTCIVVGSKTSGSSTVATATVLGKQASFWLTMGNPTVPTPGGESSSKLNDVSCSSSTACTAVGSYDKDNKVRTLAIRLTSSREWSWTPTLQTSADPASGSAELLGVSCPTESSCVAVGKNDASTFAEHWDGANWTIQATPTPSGATFEPA